MANREAQLSDQPDRLQAGGEKNGASSGKGPCEIKQIDHHNNLVEALDEELNNDAAKEEEEDEFEERDEVEKAADRNLRR